MPTAFFLHNVDAEPLYELLRDDPEFGDVKDYVEQLWITFHDDDDDHNLADKNFQSKAPKAFHQHFWEMYLGSTLRTKGMELKRIGGEGLEYYIKMEDGRRLWVEAVAPTAGSGQNSVPPFASGQHLTEQLAEVPVKAILLRFTSVFRSKLDAYHKAVKKGIVKQGEQFVLAINARAIPDWPLHTDLPLFLKALLPIGPQVFHISADATTTDQPTHLKRERIHTGAGAPVSTMGLLENDAIPLAAVLHSEVNALNHPAQLGDDFDALLNPRATPSLPADYFAWARRRYRWDSGVLTVVP